MKLIKLLYDHFGYVIFLTTLLALISTWFWANGYETIFQVLAILSILLIYPGIGIAVVEKVRNFGRYAKSISKLFILYIEIIVAFASIYVWIVLLSNNTAFSGFENVQIMTVTKESFVFSEYFISLSTLFIDCFHYSVVTATTLGYGDVYPKSPYAKLIVDFQVLSSLGIAIFGAGKYFESRQKT